MGTPNRNTSDNRDKKEKQLVISKFLANST